MHREDKIHHIDKVYAAESEIPYVIHHSSYTENQNRQVECNPVEVKDRLIDANITKKDNEYGDDNVYLQQIPSRGRCKVQLAVDSLYEHEVRGGSIRSNIKHYYTTDTSTKTLPLPYCSKLPCYFKALLIKIAITITTLAIVCLLYTSPSPRDS